MSGQKIIDGLTEARDQARLASEVAVIIQNGVADDISSTLLAYEILDHLGILKLHRRPRQPLTGGAE